MGPARRKKNELKYTKKSGIYQRSGLLKAEYIATDGEYSKMYDDWKSSTEQEKDSSEERKRCLSGVK